MALPKKIQYRLIKTKEYVEDSGTVTAYGICCREDHQTREQRRVQYRIIPNISTEPEFVEELIDKLIRNDADPVHLRELIEDYLP